MNKLDAWLTKHGLKNMLTLVVVLVFLLFVFNDRISYTEEL